MVEVEFQSRELPCSEAGTSMNTTAGGTLSTPDASKSRLYKRLNVGCLEAAKRLVGTQRAARILLKVSTLC